jgi:hypothetical protein
MPKSKKLSREDFEPGEMPEELEPDSEPKASKGETEGNGRSGTSLEKLVDYRFMTPKDRMPEVTDIPLDQMVNQSMIGTLTVAIKDYCDALIDNQKRFGKCWIEGHKKLILRKQQEIAGFELLKVGYEGKLARDYIRDEAMIVKKDTMLSKADKIEEIAVSKVEYRALKERKATEYFDWLINTLKDEIKAIRAQLIVVEKAPAEFAKQKLELILLADEWQYKWMQVRRSKFGTSMKDAVDLAHDELQAQAGGGGLSGLLGKLKEE